MNTDKSRLDRFESEILIRNFCENYSNGAGVSLTSIEFEPDTQSIADAYTIIVNANPDITKRIIISREGLEDYQGRVGTETTDAKIRLAIDEISSDRYLGIDY